MDGWISGRWHADGNNLVRERIQDVEPILDRNKALQNAPQSKSELMGHHIASIPLVIVEKWINEDNFNVLDTAKHGKQAITQFLRRKLSDPDWRYLRAR